MVRLCLRRVFYDSIEAAVGAKSQRVIISGQFKIAQGLYGIRQRKLATPRAKMKFGILRINRGGLFIFFERARIITRRLKRDSFLINVIPLPFLDFVQTD